MPAAHSRLAGRRSATAVSSISGIIPAEIFFTWVLPMFPKPITPIFTLSIKLFLLLGISYSKCNTVTMAAKQGKIAEDAE
jgi:hypothetical protein